MTKTNNLTDKAVQAKTGRTWADWLAVLDEAGAAQQTHKEIAQLLTKTHGLDPWWAQMVTVGYEQSRGLREKHEKPEGYEVSRSKTITVPVAAAYEAWQQAALRKKWLGETGLKIRKATEHRSLRITWSDGTDVTVNFYPKGDEKCQVVAQHGKLPDAAAAESRKAYWAEKLDALKALLESATPAGGSGRARAAKSS